RQKGQGGAPVRVIGNGIVVLFAAFNLGPGAAATMRAAQAQPTVGAGSAAFVAYYWRARPDRVQEYNAYILDVAEPIDEDARRAGVFEEVRTVTPVISPDVPAPDWTHLRIFRLKDLAAVAQLGSGLDAATLRVVPDEAQRKANSARSAGLRDLVRREVWTELK
ncbi:MAG: hypothetical protein ACRD1H_02585, partial [Vicinamibacterales bacterium]